MPTCCKCDAILETDIELESGSCEGCLIDSYERLQAAREQRWLEDDRNWPVTPIPAPTPRDW